MRNKQPVIRFFVFWTLLFICPLSTQAQAISPWFRGGKQVWEALLKKPMELIPGKAAFSVPLSHAVAGSSIKTTPHNWMLHRISYSGLFCRIEKDILLQKNATEKAILGKLAYFHDRDAQLFNTLSRQLDFQSNETAFWSHQNVLANTLAELEGFYQSVFPIRFSGYLFTPEHIKHLLADPIQPPAFILNTSEIDTFASLNTLDQQRVWLEETLSYTKKDLAALLNKQPGSLKNYEFERYYLQKLRLVYFQTLQKILEKATDRRLSLIYRRKRSLNLDLPGAKQPMTDAQRLGFLRYHLARQNIAQINFDQPAQNSFQKYTEIKVLLSQLAPIYEPYATAEAFGVPYEKALRLGPSAPEIILGEEEGAKLRQYFEKGDASKWQQQLLTLEKQLNRLLNQDPDGVDFYTRYYRLEREKTLYSTLFLRKNIMSQFKQ